MIYILLEHVSKHSKKGTKESMIESRSSHRRCSLRKDVLKNFAKFTGKLQCQSLFFDKVASLSLQLY